MNLTTTTVVSLMIGAVLLYAAVKSQDPRDVVRKALGMEAKYTEQGFLRRIRPIGGGTGGRAPSFTGGGNGAAGSSIIPLPLAPPSV